MARRALRFFVVPQNESVADEKTRTKTPRPPLVRDPDASDRLIFNLEVEVERLVQPFRAHPFPGLLDRTAKRELRFPLLILFTVAPTSGGLSNGQFEPGFESKGLSTARRKGFKHADVFYRVSSLCASRTLMDESRTATLGSCEP